MHMAKAQGKFKVVRMGRPPKLNRELIKKICDMIKIGSYIESAVVVCGVSKTVFYQWMKKGNAKPKSIHGEFVNAVHRAVEECKIRDLMIIDKTANGRPAKPLRDDDGKIMIDHKGRVVLEEEAIQPNWQASAWRLERRSPKEWGRTEKIQEETENQNIPIEFVD
jgi:hypothetical protein